MNHRSRLLLAVGLMFFFAPGLFPVNDIAFGATAPVVSTLPAITQNIGTPVRMTRDSSGNIYVSDPSAGGIVKYKTDGTMVKFKTSKSGSGIAIAQNGDLLVTQGTYVAVLDSTTGTEKFQFGNGNLTKAVGITVDIGSTANTGYVFVTDVTPDGSGDCIQKFGTGPSYTWMAKSATILRASPQLKLTRPAGIAFEKSENPPNGVLYVANSLSGTGALPNTLNPIILLDPVTLGFYAAKPSIGLYAGPTLGNLRFSYPQGISFEYDSAGTTLQRIYVSDSFQATVQVIDGPLKTWLSNIGSHGFTGGKIFTPTDVLFDQKTYADRRLFVANGGGNLTVFGIDNLEPTNISVSNPQLTSLTVSWTNPTAAGYSTTRVYRLLSPSDPAPTLVATQANTPTSFTDSVLSQGTTYYYSVRAVDAGNVEYSGQLVSGTTLKNYNLTLNSSGTGTINSFDGTTLLSPACGTAGTPCPQTLTLPQNSQITLIAEPDPTTLFSKWTGYCDPAANNPGVVVIGQQCTLTMTADRSVTANFDRVKAFKVGTGYYDTLQQAVDAVVPGTTTIEIMAGTWPAYTSPATAMIGNNVNTIDFKTGFDPLFTEPPTAGPTIIQGTVKIKGGRMNITTTPVKIRP